MLVSHTAKLHHHHRCDVNYQLSNNHASLRFAYSQILSKLLYVSNLPRQLTAAQLSV
jgi:hypothetical protein